MDMLFPTHNIRSMTEEARKTSDIIRSIAANADSNGITVGRFVELLGESAFWLAILVFALITLFAGIVPGVSTLLAVPILLVSLQILLGSESVWLPASIAEKTISQAALGILTKKALPFVIRIEKILHPRLSWMSGGVGERLIAVVVIVVAAILIVPIPGVHFLPCLGAVILALGMLERDGAVIAIALVITIGSIDAMVELINVASHTLIHWLHHVFKGA